MKKIALTIGSDVPFFLKNPCSAIIRGRGDIIKPADFKDVFFGILIFPEICSSTKDAYRLLNRVSTENILPKFNPEDFCSISCEKWPFFNSFEQVLFKTYPKIKEVKTVLLNYGADFALMSGAGSSVFGLFKNENMVKKAYFELFNQYNQCFLFLTLAL